jgi:hypothetical protein
MLGRNVFWGLKNQWRGNVCRGGGEGYLVGMREAAAADAALGEGRRGARHTRRRGHHAIHTPRHRAMPRQVHDIARHCTVAREVEVGGVVAQVLARRGEGADGEDGGGRVAVRLGQVHAVAHQAEHALAVAVGALWRRGGEGLEEGRGG